MLKGTPACNLYVIGLEQSSKANIITQKYKKKQSLIYDNEFPAKSNQKVKNQ